MSYDQYPHREEKNNLLANFQDEVEWVMWAAIHAAAEVGNLDATPLKRIGDGHYRMLFLFEKTINISDAGFTYFEIEAQGNYDHEQNGAIDRCIVKKTVVKDGDKKRHVYLTMGSDRVPGRFWVDRIESFMPLGLELEDFFVGEPKLPNDDEIEYVISGHKAILMEVTDSLSHLCDLAESE